MKKLLSIEYTKLKKLNSLRIILMCYVVLLPLVMLFLQFIFSKSPLPIFPPEKYVYSFPGIWKFVTYSASCLNVLIGVTIVIIVNNEMQYRTMKQSVINGLSKAEVIKSQLLVILGISALITAYTFLVGLLIGGFYGGFGTFYQNIHMVMAYFLQTITYFTFAFFIAVIVRRAALAIVFFIVAFPLETIIGWILEAKVSVVPYQFFPLKVFAELTPFPFFERLQAAQVKQKGFVEWVMPVWGEYLLVFTYLFLFFFIAYRVLKRRDI